MSRDEPIPPTYALDRHARQVIAQEANLHRVVVEKGLRGERLYSDQEFRLVNAMVRLGLSEQIPGHLTALLKGVEPVGVEVPKRLLTICPTCQKAVDIFGPIKSIGRISRHSTVTHDGLVEQCDGSGRSAKLGTRVWARQRLQQLDTEIKRLQGELVTATAERDSILFYGVNHDDINHETGNPP